MVEVLANALVLGILLGVAWVISKVNERNELK